MNISNVVLDRDKGVVTYDTSELKQVETNAYLDFESDEWFVSDDILHSNEINAVLRVSPTPEQEPTPDYYHKIYKGVKLDPYRICKIYDVNGGPREHITKKMLRGINKDDGINTELDLIKVVEGQLRRWKEMIKEDAE